MAVVLSSSSSEDVGYFSPGTLHRSHSQPKFGNPPQSSFLSRSASKTQLHGGFGTVISPSPSASSTTSAPCSPRSQPLDSVHTSYTSTPASSLSLDHPCSESEDDDEIVFPSYDDVGYYGQVEDLEAPASPQNTGDSYTASPASDGTSPDSPRAGSPEPVEHAEDDSAIRRVPSRHVDYLSHNWREEDIWSSWKHIVSKRKAYGNSARLENASWRTWTKAKNKLKTVSPETLNW